MKNIKSYSVILMMVTLSIIACKDSFLEVAPTGTLSSVELSSKEGLEVGCSVW